MIPEKFFFKAYNSFTYKDFPEPNSSKPKNINELIDSIPKLKFSRNQEMDNYLKKYFSFPYEKKPVNILIENLNELIHFDNSNKFEPIINDKEIMLYKILGNSFSFFSLFLSQIKLKFNIGSKNSYFDFLFFLKK